MSSRFTVDLTEPHAIAGGEATLTVADYEDLGSMYFFELEDGNTRSVGKQLVTDIRPADD